MNDEKKDAYVDWLTDYRWDWACTLKFRNGIRRKSAHRLWREWITKLEEIEGHRLSFVRMGEVGKIAGKFHFHGVIAGLQRAALPEAKSLWLHMAGDPRIEAIYSDDWIEYMLKDMERTDDPDIDLALFREHARTSL